MNRTMTATLAVVVACTCGPAIGQEYGPPATLAPPIVEAPALAPVPSSVATGCCPAPGPVIPLVPATPAFTVGRGIFGQPTLYIPGQPVRNFFRYITW